MHVSTLELISRFERHRLACVVHACACGWSEDSIWSFEIAPGLVWLVAEKGTFWNIFHCMTSLVNL